MIDPESFTLGPALLCGDLSPAAKSIEESVEFKRATQQVLEGYFGPMTAEFGTPFATLDRESLPLKFSDAGHADDAQLRSFLTEHLARFDHSGQAWALGVERLAYCVRTPSGWVVVGGYELESGMEPSTEIVRQYESAQGSIADTSVRDELVALPFMLLVQWKAETV